MEWYERFAQLHTLDPEAVSEHLALWFPLKRPANISDQELKDLLQNCELSPLKLGAGYSWTLPDGKFEDGCLTIQNNGSILSYNGPLSACVSRWTPYLRKITQQIIPNLEEARTFGQVPEFKEFGGSLSYAKFFSNLSRQWNNVSLLKVLTNYHQQLETRLLRPDELMVPGYHNVVRTIWDSSSSRFKVTVCLNFITEDQMIPHLYKFRRCLLYGTHGYHNTVIRLPFLRMFASQKYNQGPKRNRTRDLKKITV